LHSLTFSPQGLAVFTVLKVGFLGSARFGSGIVVARLPDGTWSAPSAIVTAGVGFGGQVGMELTDFVFILNTESAVRTFSQMGSLSLGGNLSVATGPIGRNMEISGTASIKGVAAVYSYSKTKGLFGGVSIEGGILAERRFANNKLYGRKVAARQLLSGEIEPPPAAERLMSVLSSPVFSPKLPAEVPAEVPVEMPAEVAVGMPAELPAETPAEMPIELPAGSPSEVSSEVPAEVPAELLVELPVEVLAQLPVEVLSRLPAKVPHGQPEDRSEEQPEEQFQGRLEQPGKKLDGQLGKRPDEYTYAIPSLG
jgi:lipid-binding SYLF domain-containing protein